MSQLSDKKEKSEIERIVDLDRMGANGTAVDIVASDGERAALAKRFGFLGLPAFSARVTVDRRIGGQIVVEGRLRGKIVQACVLTLDPVTQELDDAFRIVFKKDLADERDPESGEAVLSAQADAPEPLVGKYARCRRNCRRAAFPDGRSLSAAARRQAGRRPAKAAWRRPQGPGRAAPASLCRAGGPQRQAAPRALNCCGGETFWLEKAALPRR